MPAKKETKTKLRALRDLSLRKSPHKEDPLYWEWFQWPAGTVFEPPEHMKVDLAIGRGIAEYVDGQA